MYFVISEPKPNLWMAFIRRTPSEFTRETVGYIVYGPRELSSAIKLLFDPNFQKRLDETLPLTPGDSWFLRLKFIAEALIVQAWKQESGKEDCALPRLIRGWMHDLQKLGQEHSIFSIFAELRMCGSDAYKASQSVSV